jgi:hypothetical protein
MPEPTVRDGHALRRNRRRHFITAHTRIGIGKGLRASSFLKLLMAL